MEKCIMCEKDIPKDRGKKDTCSDECGFDKQAAWVLYIRHNKDQVMKEALAWYARTKKS